jgi:hypothetical protein
MKVTCWPFHAAIFKLINDGVSITLVKEQEIIRNEIYVSYIHIYIYTHTHTYIHTNIHTYTHSGDKDQEDLY